MTIQNRSLTNATPAPQVKAATSAKATAAAPELINRRMVADALDHPNSRDGVISDEEFAKAGINVDANARAAINAGGELGDKISVNELAAALMGDKVTLEGDGNATFVDGLARFNNAHLRTSSTWNFPDIPGLRILKQVKDIAPGGAFSYYNPDSPGSQFTYTREERGRSLMNSSSLSAGEYAADYSGNRVSPNTDGSYPAGTYAWRTTTYVDYDELASVLDSKARAIASITDGATDPELRTINRQVRDVLNRGFWSSDEQQARNLYSALSYIDSIDVPTSPESRMTSVHNAVNGASSALDTQFRIVREIPVETARQAVSEEVERLTKPTTTAKMVGTGIGAVAGGVGAFFALPAMGVALAGLPLIGAAVGVAAVAGGLGWLIGKLVNDGKAKGFQRDLEVLASITPEKNKRDLSQYSLSAYKMLQDARTVNTLARLRAYDEDAVKAHSKISGMTSTIQTQTNSLKNMEALVKKYTG